MKDLAIIEIQSNERDVVFSFFVAMISTWKKMAVTTILMIINPHSAVWRAIERIKVG
jgi:hypothetical protein